MNKPSVTCIHWERILGATLIGRASIRFDDFGIIITEIEVHRSTHFWIQSPLAAVVIDDELVRDSRGEIQYRPAFSVGPDLATAVIDAVRSYDPNALAAAEPEGPA